MTLVSYTLVSIENASHMSRLSIETDIKPDNMMFSLDMTPEEVEKRLLVHSAELDDGQSHPFPARFEYDCDVQAAKQMRVTLIDFGQGMSES